MTNPPVVERIPVWLYPVGGMFMVAMVLLVAASVSRPEVPEFEPTELVPRGVPSGWATDTVTIDARNGAEWALFDLETRSMVEAPAGDWDLAVKRFHMVTNGGPGLSGAGGAALLDGGWDAVTEAPASGYAVTAGALGDGATHPVLDHWYVYGFFSHILTPAPLVYALRTAEGRYAKFRILGYYCPGANPGCMTIEYAVQGDGTRQLAP